MMFEQYQVPFLVILRTIAFTYASPILGSKFLPGKVKIFLSIVLGIIAYLAVFEGKDIVVNDFYLAAVTNMAIGAFLGLMLNVMVNFLSIGGHFIAMGSGLGFATLADPANGGQTTALASFYKTCGLLIFVSLGGFLSLLIISYKSFNVFDLEVQNIAKLDVDYVLSFFSFALESALLLAAPMVFAVFLVNLSFGVMSKASPSLNIFSVGFPAGILVTFLFMTFTIDSLPYLVIRLLDEMPRLISGDFF